MLSERLEKMTSRDKENLGILVKSIIEKDPSMIRVKDGALIPYYVHNSKYMVEVEFTDKASLEYTSCRGKQYSDDFNGLKKMQLELAQEVDANYIFVSNFYQETTLLGVMTPFRIISEKEEEFLLKNFYKNVPENVSKAVEELGIVIYDKFYSYYTQGDISMLNDALHASRDAWNNYSPFFKFVFNLPYEEQNIESNKKVLRIAPLNFDLMGIMAKEYSEGKHFQEYFENISHFEEKKVVEAIKVLERKPDHDVYLLKKGFIVGEDSAIGLYKQDATAFMNYFRKLGDESRKIIIEKIYEDSFVNQEVVEWLEKSYTDLLREVGFSGGKQDGSNK
ncbi:MAG: hypothetical protein Q8O03_00630 [Nanoarchaeota archaeon]|nr:hypothetical protein [Nanoarchaeota archaeon]